MIPENVLDKYIKVWNLVERNAPESPAARAIMQGMEQKYAGIREQAHALRTAMSGGPSAPPPEPEGRPWEEVYADQQQRKQWDAQQQQNQQQKQQQTPDWRNAAANAFEWAASYAHQAFGALEAQHLAERVKVEGRNNASGSLSIIARFDPNVANYASLLSPPQKEMIAAMIARKLQEEIVFQLSR